MPRFITSSYPALAFRLEVGKFKFVGGKLDVDEEKAEAVREFVRKRPEYKIVELDAEPAVDEANDPTDQDADPTAVPAVDPDEEPDTTQKSDVIPDDPTDAGDLSADPADGFEDDTQSADANVHAVAAEQPDAGPLDGAFEDMNRKQLDEELTRRGLSTRGPKEEKVARLKEADAASV